MEQGGAPMLKGALELHDYILRVKDIYQNLYIIPINKPYINFISPTVIPFQMFPIIHNHFYQFNNHVTFIVIPYMTENIVFVPNIEEQPNKNTNYINNHCEITEQPQPNSEGTPNTLLEKDKSNKNNEVIETATVQKSQTKLKKKLHSQRYGRNICSNILHIIIKKILYYKQYGSDVIKIIEKYSMTIKLEQFYSKLYFKQNKLKEYVPFDRIIQFYTGYQNKIKEGIKRHLQFCKILRILTQIYIQREHIPFTMNCGKLKKQSKHFHLRQSHKLESILRGTYKQDYKS